MDSTAPSPVDKKQLQGIVEVQSAIKSLQGQVDASKVSEESGVRALSSAEYAVEKCRPSSWSMPCLARMSFNLINPSPRSCGLSLCLSCWTRRPSRRRCRR